MSKSKADSINQIEKIEKELREQLEDKLLGKFDLSKEQIEILLPFEMAKIRRKHNREMRPDEIERFKNSKRKSNLSSPQMVALSQQFEDNLYLEIAKKIEQESYKDSEFELRIKQKDLEAKLQEQFDGKIGLTKAQIYLLNEKGLLKGTPEELDKMIIKRVLSDEEKAALKAGFNASLKELQSLRVRIPEFIEQGGSDHKYLEIEESNTLCMDSDGNLTIQSQNIGVLNVFATTSPVSVQSLLEMQENNIKVHGVFSPLQKAETDEEKAKVAELARNMEMTGLTVLLWEEYPTHSIKRLSKIRERDEASLENKELDILFYQESPCSNDNNSSVAVKVAAATFHNRDTKSLAETPYYGDDKMGLSARARADSSIRVFDEKNKHELPQYNKLASEFEGLFNAIEEVNKSGKKASLLLQEVGGKYYFSIDAHAVWGKEPATLKLVEEAKKLGIRFVSDSNIQLLEKAELTKEIEKMRSRLIELRKYPDTPSNEVVYSELIEKLLTEKPNKFERNVTLLKAFRDMERFKVSYTRSGDTGDIVSDGKDQTPIVKCRGFMPDSRATQRHKL